MTARCFCVELMLTALTGYLYFHAAPDKDAFHQESVKRVKNLHTADCLRANKSTMAWGLEARVPFLDKKFLEVAMNIRPEDKMFGKTPTRDSEGRPRMEKYVLRKAFDVSPDGRVRLSRAVHAITCTDVLWPTSPIFPTLYYGGRKSSSVTV